jgi:hypothetical protein
VVLESRHDHLPAWGGICPLYLRQSIEEAGARLIIDGLLVPVLQDAIGGMLISE